MPKSLPFLVTAITYLLLGSWIILHQKNKVQKLYGALCIATCFWQGVWVFLLSTMPGNTIYLLLKVGYSGIVFIPAIFYHFIAEFSQKETRSRWIIWTYMASTLLAMSVWFGHQFLTGLNRYSWGLAAKAGIVHPLYLILITFVVVRMFILLRRAGYQPDTPVLKRQQIKWVMAALAIYSFGSLDLISNYGIAVFPLSCLFTGVAFILFTYAIFRYKLLAIAVSAESEDEKKRRIAASQEMNRLGMT